MLNRAKRTTVQLPPLILVHGVVLGMGPGVRARRATGERRMGVQQSADAEVS